MFILEFIFYSEIFFRKFLKICKLLLNKFYNRSYFETMTLYEFLHFIFNRVQFFKRNLSELFSSRIYISIIFPSLSNPKYSTFQRTHSFFPVNNFRHKRVILCECVMSCLSSLGLFWFGGPCGQDLVDFW